MTAIESRSASLFPEALRAARVAVVDDNQVNVVVLEKTLRASGLEEVHGFTDPRRALAFCAETPPDLVLLDLHMPGLDGIGVIEELQRGPYAGTYVPVIVLTADITPQARDRVLAAGAKDFLTKPFDRGEVILRVRNVLETRTLYTRLEMHNGELRSELDAREAQERAVADEHDRLRRTIDEVLIGGGPTMVFQPIADLTTGRVVGAEALARFEGGRPPNEWFDDAAVVGRGTPLEMAAVHGALSKLGTLPADVFVSVNVSPATAVAPGLADVFGSFPGHRVVLELTEHTRVEDYPALLRSLEPVRAQGVRIAVDDTGAGYAGLQLILRLAPDVLKLDTDLTQGIDSDPVRRALASALVAFGREVGAVIVAEGIETAGELAVLRDLGIEWGQGYHLARPGPLPLSPYVS